MNGSSPPDKDERDSITAVCRGCQIGATALEPAANPGQGRGPVRPGWPLLRALRGVTAVPYGHFCSSEAPLRPREGLATRRLLREGARYLLTAP